MTTETKSRPVRRNHLTAHGGRNRHSNPGIVLSAIIFKGCLEDLPWFSVPDCFSDRHRFERWAQRLAPDELATLQRREHENHLPLGPDGMWARAEDVYSRWQRPHRLDEVFVETMYPLWAGERALEVAYLTVLSSGPLGLYAVYVDEDLQYLIGNPPQIWLNDLSGRALVVGNDAYTRYAQTLGAEVGSGPNSEENSSCIFFTANG